MEPSMQNQNPVQSIASQSVSTRKHIKFVYAALIITIIGAGISFFLLNRVNTTVSILDIENSAKEPEKLLPTEFREYRGRGADVNDKNDAQYIKDNVYFLVHDSISFHQNYINILEYFYPNGKKLLNDYGSWCYKASDFPDKFFIQLRSKSKELIFSMPYSDEDGCQYGGLDIAIPIADILREVPELVPENSVLWKFAK